MESASPIEAWTSPRALCTLDLELATSFPRPRREMAPTRQRRAARRQHATARSVRPMSRYDMARAISVRPHTLIRIIQATGSHQAVSLRAAGITPQLSPTIKALPISRKCRACRIASAPPTMMANIATKHTVEAAPTARIAILHPDTCNRESPPIEGTGMRPSSRSGIVGARGRNRNFRPWYHVTMGAAKRYADWRGYLGRFRGLPGTRRA